MKTSRLRLALTLPSILSAGLAVLLGLAVFTAAAANGFSPERLQRLDAVIHDYIARRQLAGAVVSIARDGRPAGLKAYGMQDIENGKPMPTDAIFRIASMSKAVTTVAVMMLYEEGKLLLRDPVSQYIPAFQNSVVAVPPPAGSPSGVKYVTIPAKRPIQIRDLLTHTAGLTYGDGLAIDDYKQAHLYGWGSAYYPQYLVDPQERMVALFMTQLMPDGGVDLVKKFKVLTYQALVK